MRQDQPAHAQLDCSQPLIKRIYIPLQTRHFLLCSTGDLHRHPPNHAAGSMFFYRKLRELRSVFDLVWIGA